MTSLTITELRKLSSVRITWVLTAIGLALLALPARSYIFADGIDAPAGSAERTTAAISIIGANTALVLVVGVLVVTTEFRHGTIGHTLQLTPSRTRVLTAKLAAGGIYGALFYLAAVALVTGLLLIATVGQGVTLERGAMIGTALAGNLVAMTLTATLGVAIGALVRSQVAAITGSLVWMLIVENLAATIDYRIGRWLPFQALNAIFATDQARTQSVIAPLAPELGLTVFLTYVLLATLAAGVLMTKRDV